MPKIESTRMPPIQPVTIEHTTKMVPTETARMEIKSNIYFYNALFDYVQRKRRGKNLKGVLSKIRYLKTIYREGVKWV